MAIEISDQLNGAKVIKIILQTGDDAIVYKGEYCSYELLVVTDKGVLRFAGCGDATGDIEIETAQEMIDKYYVPHQAQTVEIDINVKCPACDSVMVRRHEYIACETHGCANFGVRYESPKITITKRPDRADEE